MPDGLRRALPWAAAMVAGAALLVAHPPVGWWWATFLAPPALVAALLGRPDRAPWLGALTAVVAYGPMLSWLILPAGYLAWGLLVAVQAAFLAVLAVLVRPWLRSRWLPVAVAVLWMGLDAWRAVFPLGGFEWGAIAYAHADGTFVLPVARVLGGRAITLLVVLIAVAVLEAVRAGWASARRRGDLPMDQALTATNLPLGLAVGGLLAAVLITVEPPAEVGSLDVLSVQGNDTGPDDVRPDDPQLAITSAMRDLTVGALEERPGADLVVWPESSVDRDPASPRGERLAPVIAEAQAALGDDATLLAGMTLDGPDPTTQFVNSVIALDREGEYDRYVKRQPVPFGEYIPARRYLDWFPPLEQIPRDAVRGEAGQPIDIAGVGVAVGICFETMFGGVLRESITAGDDPAGLLVLVTNNASFGRSAQPDQHIAQSQLRAVETGRWVVHGALSGSSAFIGPTGEVTARTGLYEQATLRDELPVVTGTTPFLVIGDVLGLLGRVAVVAALLALVWTTGRRRAAAGSAAADLPDAAGAAATSEPVEEPR